MEGIVVDFLVDEKWVDLDIAGYPGIGVLVQNWKDEKKQIVGFLKERKEGVVVKPVELGIEEVAGPVPLEVAVPGELQDDAGE